MSISLYLLWSQHSEALQGLAGMIVLALISWFVFYYQVWMRLNEDEE